MDGLCAVALYNRGKGLFSEWNSGNDEWRSFPLTGGSPRIFSTMIRPVT